MKSIVTRITLVVGTGDRALPEVAVEGGLDATYQMNPEVWEVVWGLARPDSRATAVVSGWFTPLNHWWKADFTLAGEAVAPTVFPLWWELLVEFPDRTILSYSRTDFLFGKVEDFLEYDDFRTR